MFLKNIYRVSIILKSDIPVLIKVCFLRLATSFKKFISVIIAEAILLYSSLYLSKNFKLLISQQMRTK